MVDASNADPNQAPAPQVDAVEEDMPVEIHKPKPVHNWREFLVELGTITLGVLIALAAEQTVEAFHNHERAAQARDNIHAEIATNLGQIAVRAGIEDCVTQRLNEVEGLIRALPTASLAPVWIGHPTLNTMPNSQHTAAVQSGAVNLLADAEQARYAAIYAFFEEYSQAELAEQAAWADLRMLELHPAATPVLDGQLRSALQQARNARWQIEISARAIQTAATAFGIKPNAATGFTQQSVCIPVTTTREEGEKLVLKGRPNGIRYDEP